MTRVPENASRSPVAERHAKWTTTSPPGLTRIGQHLASLPVHPATRQHHDGRAPRRTGAQLLGSSFLPASRTRCCTLPGLASALSFTDASAVTLVSGDQHFEVNGSTVSGEAAGSSDSNGTVMIPGVFEQLTFTLTPTVGDSTAKDGVFLQLGGTRPA
jgi:hypothetical protein